MNKVLFLVLLLISNIGYAVDRYVRQGAAGTASGLDWTNAYTTLPPTLNRGDTYYIADGTYGSYDFNDSVSGTTLITIRKATVAVHGTDTGWVSTYGDGQANFTAPITFSTAYWLFDGQTRNESDWFAGAAYGFKVTNNAGDYGPTVYMYGSNVTVAYAWMVGETVNAGTTTRGYVMDYESPTTTSGTVVTHSFAQKSSNHFFLRNVNGAIVEYCASSDADSNTFNHGENVNLYGYFGRSDNVIVRYNIFKDSFLGDFGTAVIAIVGATGNEIYGNVFYNNNVTDGSIGWNGTGPAGYAVSNTKIYNNTFGGGGGFNQGINFESTSNAGTNIVQNNIFCGSGTYSFTQVTASFNAFCGSSAQGTSNAQVNLSTSVFINSAGRDYRLNSATTAGTTLASPYNTDRNGLTRGADGSFDRGAFEFSAADTTPPTVSSTVPVSAATGISVSDNVTATFSEALNAGTVTTTTASIKRTSDNSPVTSTVSYASNQITINPNADLAAGTQYTGTLTTGIQDAAGNALAVTYTWTFTTAAGGDTSPPTVVVRIPAPGATGVKTNVNVDVIFSELIDTATATISSMELRRTSDNALITSTIVSTTAGLRRSVIVPSALLATNTQYTVIIKGGGSGSRISDVAGNFMAANDTWTFTTGENVVNNTLTISNENYTNTTWRIVKGQTFSSANGNCITVTNSSYIKFVNNRFIDCWLSGVHAESSHHITVLGNYFENTGQPVHAPFTTGSIVVKNNKSKNTMRRHNSARGNRIIQFNGSSGAGNIVAGNYSFDDPNSSTSEDGVTSFNSSFPTGNELIMENNILRGGSRSGSSAGLNAGDSGGTDYIIRNNICYDCGQVGISASGGQRIVITGNLLYSSFRPNSNIGTGIYKSPPDSPATCANNTLGVNTIDWTNFNNIRNFSDGHWIDTATCTGTTSSAQILNVDLSSMPLPTFGDFIKPSGLVAAYDFETDCFLCDFGAGNEINSNISYMPTVLDGHIGKGAYFDGTKRMTVPLKPTDFTNAYSFSMWVKRDAEAATRNTAYVEESREGVTGMLYGRVIFNALQQRTSARYKRFFGYNNAGAISATGWNHIVITYAAGIAKLYVNGVLRTTSVWVKPQESLFTALQIGGMQNNKKFKGLIDQLYVFNKALSQGEVTALFNQTVN